MKSIAVYCGSSPGNNPAHREAAKRLGRRMAEDGITLIYGGGSIGLMGMIADAILRHGGRAIGVIPRFLDDYELGHSHLTELIVVETMHERKQRMIDLAEAFIALPGGFGTLEELAEVLAWSQLGLHNAPCGVLNVNGYYDGLLACTNRMEEDGLLRLEDRERLLDDPTPEGLLAKMASWKPPAELKWKQLKPEKL